MREWWSGLQPRERRIVIAGAGALALILLYAAIWLPLAGGRAELRGRVAENQATLNWMQQAVRQVQQLRGAGAARPATGQSLLALVDQTAKQQQLAGVVKRIEPAGQEGVRVWVEQAEFDTLLTWFELLQRDHNVRIKNITVERGAVDGRVNARMAFEGGA
jgi:general secretion pathway protein M